MDIVKAIFVAFLPISVLTYVITYFSYSGGHIRIENDKRNKLERFSSKDALDEDFLSDDDYGDLLTNDKKSTNNLLHKKWVNFGGGFYGLMALITFTVIEVRQVFNFLINFPGMDYLVDMLSINGFTSLVLDFVQNMIDAFLWFNYWPDYIDIGNGWIWLGLTYSGYYFGRQFAEWRLRTR